jgi:hypothetical protein
MNNTHVIMCRSRRLINTDPQRRCYNGAHFSSELVWTNWEELCSTNMERAEARLAYWRDLNDFAVSQRGEEARSEYKLVEIKETKVTDANVQNT